MGMESCGTPKMMHAAQVPCVDWELFVLPTSSGNRRRDRSQTTNASTMAQLLSQGLQLRSILAWAAFGASAQKPGVATRDTNRHVLRRSTGCASAQSAAANGKQAFALFGFLHGLWSRGMRSESAGREVATGDFLLPRCVAARGS